MTFAQDILRALLFDLAINVFFSKIKLFTVTSELK